MKRSEQNENIMRTSKMFEYSREMAKNL